MKCIICYNEQLDNFANTSYMELPIKYCKKCNTYITGSSEEEVRKKSKEVFKKGYWEGYSLNSNKKLIEMIGL